MEPTMVLEALGGRDALGHDVRTQLDLIELGRTGVPKASLVHLAEYMGTSMASLADLLPVTRRTIQRYAPTDHFNRVISEQILQLAAVATRGAEVFGDKAVFNQWLTQACAALGCRTPISLLNSRFGAEMVLDELTRIEHGVVA